MDELTELRRTAAWHYRFEDTWAWQFVEMARREWEAVGEESEPKVKERVRRRACVNLKTAEKSLLAVAVHRFVYRILGAQRDFGDPHIAQHRRQLETLQRRIGCLD